MESRLWSCSLMPCPGTSPSLHPELPFLMSSLPPRTSCGLLSPLCRACEHVQQGPASPQQEMPGLRSAPPSLLCNPLTRACLPNSNNNSKDNTKAQGLTDGSQNFPAVTMALFTHSRDGRVLQSSEEEGIFDVSFHLAPN